MTRLRALAITAALLALASAGCGSSSPGVEAFADGTARLSVDHSELRGTITRAFVLTFEPIAPFAPPHCPSLASAEATLNGASIDVLEGGNPEHPLISVFPPSDECLAAGAFGVAPTLPPPGRATVRVDQDDVVAIASDGLLLERGFLAPATAAPGSDVELQSLVPGEPTGNEPYTVVLALANRRDELPARLVENGLELTLPPDLPDGDATLELGYWLSLPVQQCDGVATCEATATWHGVIPLAIAR